MDHLNGIGKDAMGKKLNSGVILNQRIDVNFLNAFLWKDAKTEMHKIFNFYPSLYCQSYINPRSGFFRLEYQSLHRRAADDLVPMDDEMGDIGAFKNRGYPTGILVRKMAASSIRFLSPPLKVLSTALCR